MFFELRMLMLAILAIMFVFFVILLRRQKLELKYCLVWLIAIVGVAVFCIFPTLLHNLSTLLGIDVPVNALFIVCIAFLTCICISLTLVVSSLSDKLRKLTQYIAINELEQNNDVTNKQISENINQSR
ncbi:MAG: DUF2304 domain-containing protein [Oscillospiraceae bacterium]|jgi:hypothetical protein|nr:DUF2304 domain-containing protein [Oscillospiraceae bacterium]